MWHRPELLRYGGDYVEGAVVASAYTTQRATAANRGFLKAFSQHLRGTPNLMVTYAYGATAMLRELVLSRRLTQRSDLREALSSLDFEDGLMGKISASGEGDLAGEVVLIKVEGKAFELEGKVAP